MVSLRSVLVIAAIPALFLVGCSKSDSASTTTTTAATCRSDIESLKSDLSSLANFDVISKGTDALRSQIDKIQSDLTALKASAKSAAATQIDAFDAAIRTLTTSMDAARSGELTMASASDVITAIGEAGTAGMAVLTQLDSACT